MKTKGKLLLTLFLITWVAFAFTSFTNKGQQYIGKSYFDSNEFKNTVEQYKEQLGRLILLPIDAEKEIENITVTKSEIDSYRNYYGTLSEQIESIQNQYNDRIAEAEAGGNVQFKEGLIKERDNKIADIEQNFASDEYVEEKIVNQKAQAIRSFVNEQQRQAKDFLNGYQYFTYSFKNVDTGEVIEAKKYNQKDATVYSEKFGKPTPYFNVDNTINISSYDGSVLEEFSNYTVQGEGAQFEGSISIPKSLMAASHMQGEYSNFTFAKMTFYLIWVTGIIALIALFTFAKPTSSQFRSVETLETSFSKWPIDLRAIFVLILANISLSFMGAIENMLQHNMYYYVNYWMSFNVKLITYGIFVFITSSVTILGVVWLWKTVRDVEGLKIQLKNAYFYRMAEGAKDLLLDRSIAFQSIFVLGVAFFAGIGITGVALFGGELVLIYLVLFFFIALPAVLSFLNRMGYLNRIVKQTEDMAEGRLTTDIKVKGKSPLAQHAKNLNRLREGVKKSMIEQAKSERLKTELITNVSHDLRTPLTSIITYTDLLKNPDITEDERKRYIDVLDKKSARLKTLIEDLFEVSKMASGNIELSKQRVDLTQLFKQAIGEHDESFKEIGLDLKVSTPEQQLYAYVDGQKIWRVLDNLVVNALKYSLKGSRVYLTLKQNGRDAEFTVKNISSYELGDHVEELTERFKRADASRHTDGSGLGLAIAQSIVDLHNGRMSIEVDGDLFKVTVTIPADY
ncbi:MFS domain-containing histidine kinase [Ureibacillus manganicus]|uniref:histidine kinase n=1 Tax=Ureibacillus manganicus DSM 26584 TaxID=1384049 RepID=A0A0A3I3J5_9BACL|nr:MFS domain-containing histidine kinase [Ureibacillus manganicus]KGR79361.1 hypothetical protein CD29_06610 [Ureibacillus manganicus DSM 26584]